MSGYQLPQLPTFENSRGDVIAFECGNCKSRFLAIVLADGNLNIENRHCHCGAYNKLSGATRKIGHWPVIADDTTCAVAMFVSAIASGPIRFAWFRPSPEFCRELPKHYRLRVLQGELLFMSLMLARECNYIITEWDSQTLERLYG